MLHLITPLYRYNNIKIVYQTIKYQLDDYCWHLIEGSNKIGEENLDFLREDERVKFYKINTEHIWGHEQRNYFITNIGGDDNDWCYFLDDDNILTPDLVNTYHEEMHTNTDLVLFTQKKGLTDIIRLYSSVNHLSLGNCDIGSFIIRYRLMKKTIIPYIDQRNADGHYAEQIRNYNDSHEFKYYTDRYVRYNSLSLEIT